MNFQSLHSMEERLDLMKSLATRFSERASINDEEGTFPAENIKELISSGYTSLTVPKEYGGLEISLYEFIRLQESIAQGDGSTALSIGWHMGLMKNLSEKRLWKEDFFKIFCEEVIKGAVFNAAATEPQTGSPTRGGKPHTKANKTPEGWLINGRKSFTTMAPILDYFIVSASIEDSEDVGNFLIHRTIAGVSVEETWDSIAMRGTGSHDLILDNVLIESDCLVEILDRKSKKANGWLLHIPACYLGIAQAAQSYSIEFAKTYAPNGMETSILQFPSVQQKIGEMEHELMQARSYLFSLAKIWDASTEEERNHLNPQLGSVKMAVTNTAIKVVDLAMRVVGAKSLSLQNPLQRYYRDVRAGLHNPPMDDMTIQLLAKNAIERVDS